MLTNANQIGRWSRAVLLVAVIAASGLTAACTDWLEVTNPGAIEPPDLENQNYIPLMVNGVLGDFQASFAWDALWSGVFTDELRNHHGYFENGEIDRREINEGNGTYALSIYNGLHRTRFLGDSVAGRLKNLLGDSASRNLSLARVLGMAGYAYVLLGEQYCEIPINLSAPKTPEEILNTAIERFDEAIAVATAARAAATTPAGVAGADSVMNMARVGAARAALFLNNKSVALTYAQAVTPAYVSDTDKGFQYVAYFVDGPSGGEDRRYGNPFYEFISAGRWFSFTDTPFDRLNDPRVPTPPDSTFTAQGTQQYIPRSPTAFSTYDGTVNGALFNFTSRMRVASAIEARYIIAEAEGLTAANLAFINDRRAVGNEELLPDNTTAADYMAALRNERAREFYLDGHRMGDIRRYKAHEGIDLWPTGPYFGSATVTYGEQECFPLTSAEKIGNPNL